MVNNKVEALARFKQANYLDRKINAYRWHEVWAIQLLGQAPENIFAEQDEHDFKSAKAFELAVRRTLRNFKENLDGAPPTMINSGNGVHLIQPVDGHILEEYAVFTDLCEDPSNRFHRFAERFFTNNKSDSKHNPTFLSSMLRVPGSINSKNMAQIRIIQKWNGVRPAINWVLRYFRRYLIQERFDEALKAKQRYRYYHSNDQHRTNNKIDWIESLYGKAVEEHCKYSIWRILTPYFINIKRLSMNQTFKQIMAWLNRCDSVSRLGFNAKSKMNDSLDSVANFCPVSQDKLRLEHKQSYSILKREKIVC